MKCPIFFADRWTDESGTTHETGDCLKADCEWWSATSQQCRVCSISGELYSLVEVMEEIRDNIVLLVKATGIRG